MLTEQLTTSLTNKEIPVVERALLDKVLGEQFLQHSFLFDEKTAQRLGKQLGATAILTGRIVGRGEAHVRLIDVKSGRILLAASGRLATARPTSPKPTAKSQNVDSRTGRGQVTGAGDKILPGFFLTRDAALVMREGLVIRGDSVLRSRTGDFTERDFVFEIVYEFGKLTAAGERDHSVHVGIGDDSLEDGHPQKCVGLDIRPTTINSEGRITLLTRSDGRRGAKEDLFGLVRKPGPHRLKIEKSNATLTFRLDVDNDGETVDDLEMTIPDLREFAPFLHEKNSYLYIGGGGVFTNGRLSFDGVGSRINAVSLRAGQDDRMYPLRRGEPWPEFLQAGDNAVIAKDGLEVRAHTYVATKRGPGRGRLCI